MEPFTYKTEARSVEYHRLKHKATHQAAIFDELGVRKL